MTAYSLREAALLARNTFEAYAALHREKGTPEGDAKAALNVDLAARMNSGIASERTANEDLTKLLADAVTAIANLRYAVLRRENEREALDSSGPVSEQLLAELKRLGAP